jgi:hypothetical protein
MIDPKAVALFREVFAKTNAKKLVWQTTADKSVFVVPMGGQFALKAYSYTTSDAEGKTEGSPSITLYDGDNIVLDITEEIDSITAVELESLYQKIYRQATHADEKIDLVIDKLRQL